MKKLIARMIMVMQALFVLCMFVVLRIPFDRRYYIHFSVQQILLTCICVALFSLWYLYYFFRRDIYEDSAFAGSAMCSLTFGTCIVAWYSFFEFMYGYEVQPLQGLLIVVLSLIPTMSALVASVHKNTQDT